jgi:YfiH family protein
MIKTSSLLSGYASLRHGFFTRQGGVSEGLYASLNLGLGSRDNPAAVMENRCIVAQQLGIDESHLCTLRQVHSPDVVTLDKPYDKSQAPEADALVTNQPNIALGMLTADCAPILFYDPEAQVIGAAHAGWKGALGGVIEATLRAMAVLGATPAQTLACIGACIRQPSYEVDHVFYQQFLSQSAAYQTFFAGTDNPLKFRFDLAGFVRFRLYNAGVFHIDDLEDDTASNTADYFSFRRATLNGEEDYGRQISVIMLV